MNSTRDSGRRVVITGMGLVSPLGNSPAALWESLKAGKSGVVPIDPAVDPPAVPYIAAAREFTGEIDDFGPLEGAQKKSIRKALKSICREAKMGVAAAQLAMFDAGLTAGKYVPEEIGAVFGADYMVSEPQEFTSAVDICSGPEHHFQMSRWGSEGLEKMDPLWLLKYLPNMPAAHLAIYNDLRGPNNSLTHREASSHLAFGEAMRIIQRGHARFMIAGAAGSRLHPLKAVHAVLEQELSLNGTDPTRACRPFDLNRMGMVLGEGAGAFVLEELASARARGATIYAEVLGAGASTVVSKSRQPQNDLALANAMRGALRDAGMAPADVGHLQAHGLGTTRGDIAEARAIRAVFGDLADRLPVTALKSYMGNLGSGSGAVELIAGILALRHGTLFPILNYETPDPECPIHAVRDSATCAGSSVIASSVTQRGQASSILVRLPRDAA